MDEILKMSIEKMADVSFLCSCGKTHSLNIKKIMMGKGMIGKLPEILDNFQQEKSLYVK